VSVALKQAPESASAPFPRSLPLYRFTVGQYHRMVEAGILGPNDRVELVEGWIIAKMPRKPPHDATIARINRRLTPVLPDEWLLRVQSAITLRDSEPEPDLAIVRGPEEVYFEHHPRPRDIGLLIEVADSTLLSDRQTKGGLYAQARIARYWIINLVASVVQVYTQPRAGKFPAYRQQHDHGKEDVVPLILGDEELEQIPVRELIR
jgi:hypothetical protein